MNVVGPDRALTLSDVKGATGRAEQGGGPLHQRITCLSSLSRVSAENHHAITFRELCFQLPISVMAETSEE